MNEDTDSALEPVVSHTFDRPINFGANDTLVVEFDWNTTVGLVGEVRCYTILEGEYEVVPRTPLLGPADKETRQPSSISDGRL